MRSAVRQSGGPSRGYTAPLPWRLSAVDSVHCVDCSGLSLGREEVKNG